MCKVVKKKKVMYQFKCGNISVGGQEVKMKYFDLRITEFMDCCFRYSYKVFFE